MGEAAKADRFLDVFTILGFCSGEQSPDALTCCSSNCPAKQLVKVKLTRRMQLRNFCAEAVMLPSGTRNVSTDKQKHSLLH